MAKWTLFDLFKRILDLIHGLLHETAQQDVENGLTPSNTVIIALGSIYN